MNAEIVGTNPETCTFNEPSIMSRLRSFFDLAKRRIQQVLFRAAMSLSDTDSNLVGHAERELTAAGYDLKQTEEDPNKWIAENLLDLLKVFSMQGHSGFSAPHCVAMFEKLAQYKPLGPLTGDDSEWCEVGDGMFQNTRCGHVFKQSDRFDGQAYDIDAVVFWEWYERPLEADEEGFPGTHKSKAYFTSGKSQRPIVFPYTPTREYVEAETQETQ